MFLHNRFNTPDGELEFTAAVDKRMYSSFLMKSSLNTSQDSVVPDVTYFMKEEIKHLQ